MTIEGAMLKKILRSGKPKGLNGADGPIEDTGERLHG